ncbi:MAG: hypothetical protein QOI63_98, partial [Thermoplasmata archaeon]|nr:hypothetical protein [Thermoplasmata archaeon]
ERMEERRRLLDSARLHTEMLDAVTDGYLHVDAGWRVTFASIGSGHRRRIHDELVGRTLWEVFPRMEGTRFEEEFRAAMRTRQARVFEAYYAPAETWYEDRLFPAGDGLALYYRDVTARRRLESQLESRNRQQTTVAALGQHALSLPSLDGLLSVVAQEVATTLEVEFCKILELTPSGDFRLRAGVGWRPGLVGAAIVEAGHSQAGFTLQSDAPVVVADLRTETRFTGPSLLHEHGVTSGMSVILKGSRGPFGVLGAHTRAARAFTRDDIHFLQAVANLLATAIERSRVEEELRLHRETLESMVEQRTAALQEAVRELEAFSYTVSHDLRTPLRSIDGFSRLLLRRHAAALPPEAQAMLEAVGDGAIQMGHLIESVLALFRVGRAELARQELDLSAMATGILRQRAGMAPGRRVAWDIEPGLVASGDRDLVHLALETQLGNAWKFTARTPAARITLRREGEAFCVADNGAGFEMALAKELFQPFHRLHTPDAFEGTGIGLATVARIIRRHGGSVWAEAETDKGARFFFTLPPPGQ